MWTHYGWSDSISFLSPLVRQHRLNLQFFWTYLDLCTNTSHKVAVRLDDQQRCVRGPSHETKDDVESQEEPVIWVIVGQAFQGEADQLLTQGGLGRAGHSSHAERRREPVSEGGVIAINVTADGIKKRFELFKDLLARDQKKVPNKIKFKILIRKDILSANYQWDV